MPLRLRLKEDQPMFREDDIPNYSTPIFFKAGEEFEVIEKRIMKHDNREWFKIKSKWFSKPMQGFLNPDCFEMIVEE